MQSFRATFHCPDLVYPIASIIILVYIRLERCLKFETDLHLHIKMINPREAIPPFTLKCIHIRSTNWNWCGISESLNCI